MPEKSIEGPPSENRQAVPRWARYAFWGGACGLVSALVVLFVFSVHYGDVLGLGAASCLAYGCAMTVLISQPVGLLGMIAGTLAGVLCGTVGHHVSR